MLPSKSTKNPAPTLGVDKRKKNDEHMKAHVLKKRRKKDSHVSK
jgi:hypothetical protein